MEKGICTKFCSCRNCAAWRAVIDGAISIIRVKARGFQPKYMAKSEVNGETEYGISPQDAVLFLRDKIERKEEKEN